MVADGINQVIDRLEAIVQQSIRDRDRSGYFAALYRRVTVSIRDAIRAGQFEDGARMEALDIAFAGRYFTARSQYQTGELAMRSWLQAFDAAQSAEHTSLQQLLIAMNAHINIDLGIAVARSAATDLASLKNDFDKVMSLLASLVPQVDSEIDGLSPMTYRIDRAVGARLEQKWLDWAIHDERTSAWTFANALATLERTSQSAFIARRDAEVALFGEAILSEGPLTRLIRGRESQNVADNIETFDRTGLPSLELTDIAAIPSAQPSGAGPSISERWTDAQLDELRHATDPLADAVVQRLFTDGQVDAVTRLWKALLDNEQVPEPDLPEVVRDYFASTAALPEWADRSQIRAGQQFFEKNGLAIVAALHCASLPEAYACAKGVQVLWLNGRLLTDTKRRILETAQMIFDAMSIGGLEPTGRGIRSVQKVRLMHAAVRFLIQRSGRWNADWGAPINQEDLAGTLMTFSCTVLDAIEKLSVVITPEEAEAYLHAWKVAGAVLGIDAELLPRDLTDAKLLSRTIRRRQTAPSEAGRALTAALLEYMEAMIPGGAFKGFPATMMRYILGDAAADVVGVPIADWTTQLTDSVCRLFHIETADAERSRVLSRMAGAFSHALLTGFVWAERGGHRGQFTIPDRLHEAWQLPNPVSLDAVVLQPTSAAAPQSV
jgi:hypothetical protein